MFRRLFGAKKDAQPPPSLDDATKRVDDRAGHVDEKIKKLDAELVAMRQQMAKMRPGPAQNAIKQRALRVLKQKKMYENQRDQLYGQSFNMEQANFATQTMQDTVTTVAAMKHANATMKTQMKQMKIEDVENVYDEMQDLMEDTNEIQDLLSRSFSLGVEVDEADLEDELAALGDEIMEEDTVPSYLEATVPAPVGEPSAQDLISLPGVPVEQNAAAASSVRL